MDFCEKKYCFVIVFGMQRSQVLYKEIYRIDVDLMTLFYEKDISNTYVKY